MAITEKWMPSPNYSSRGGVTITKAVHHLTVGAQTIESLGGFFANASVQASSHHGADNAKRSIFGAYVYEQNKAWTQGNANPYCVSLELCTPSGAENWSRDYWLNNQNTLLRNAAEWTAYVCGKYGIPIVALSSSQAQTQSTKGVCQHRDGGANWGGHVDCGNGFPMDKVIEWAKSGTPSAPESEDMSTPAFAYWYNPNTDKSELYMVCIGKSDSRLYYAGPDTQYKWVMVDPNSKAIGGATLAAAKNGELTAGYVATSNAVVSYTRASGGGGWVWKDRGGQAK